MSRLSTVCAIAAAVLLAGCGEQGNVFGFDRAGPDEFSVVRHAPLSLPPDATLRPPQPGSAAAARDRGNEEARSSLVLGTPSTSGGQSRPGGGQSRPSGGQSPGETALTTRAAAYYGAEPDIKQVVDEESTRLAQASGDFVNRVLFWQKPPPPGKALDAAAESRRLRENQALGRPLNAGEAPLIVRRKSSVSSLY